MPQECCRFGGVREGLPSEDACMYGCGYLNGGFQVAVAQFLLLIGSLLSLATLVDCSFVSLDPGIMVSESGNEVVYLGFTTFQRPTGACYWYESGQNPRGQVEEYFDFLGGDWRVARASGAVAGGGGLLCFLFSLSLCCSSHYLIVRMFSAFILCVALPLFQSLTFLVFASDMCDDSSCKFSRSAGWSVGAAACFFVSGIFHLLMQNYPGSAGLEKMRQIMDESNDEPMEHAVNIAKNKEGDESTCVVEDSNYDASTAAAGSIKGEGPRYTAEEDPAKLQDKAPNDRNEIPMNQVMDSSEERSGGDTIDA